MFASLEKKARFEGPPTVHQRNLVILLRELLLAHDFTGASQVLSVLFMRCGNIPEIIFRTGLEILRHHDVGYRPTVNFFQKMISLERKNRPAIILELAFFHMRLGLFQEAYDHLGGYLLQEPYNKNPLFHGYCGILAFMIWQSLLQKARADEDEGGMSHEASVFTEHTGALRTVKDKFKVAKKHLAKAIDLDRHSFIYIQYTIALLMYREKYAQCRTIVQQFCNQNPANPAGLRLYSLILRQYFPQETEAYRECLVQLLGLDPIADVSFFEFLELYKTDVLSGQDTAEMIARRIEYLPEDAWLWKKLWKVVKKDATTPSDLPFWKERLTWWPSHFFDPESFSHLDTELILRRCLCSSLLLGEGHPFYVAATRHVVLHQGVSHPALPTIEELNSENEEEANGSLDAPPAAMDTAHDD